LTTSTQRTRYPWRRWTDGKPRVAQRGNDFWCRPESFATICYQTARAWGLRVHTRVHPDGSVYFRFYDAS
jgi:hypothetical protein